MDESKTSKVVFKQYKEEILEIAEHYNSCAYKDRSIPINECRCDCYVKQIFDIGRKAQERIFYS